MVNDQSKAEKLTNELQTLFANNKGVRVYKPQQIAELRILGLDETVDRRCDSNSRRYWRL